MSWLMVMIIILIIPSKIMFYYLLTEMSFTTLWLDLFVAADIGAKDL